MDHLRAVLAAYRIVKTASWPQLQRGMESHAARWPFADATELRAELAGYLNETDADPDGQGRGRPARDVRSGGQQDGAVKIFFQRARMK